ncbi:N-acetylmuramoyl-L-alanine amidase family protein [Marinococcus halophilus]|uniref:N-acetylmuramoyl-L-alanine amidase family protein n=1 Tax=Marinococcus halophilus TaxID=1371 RepID=UPI0009A78110|nr:N-acetylmuramoyl-L-alanine amidase [Marinococcus halophilus]
MPEFRLAEAGVAGKTIAIKAGHSGHDPGAVRDGVYEKELVHDVAVRTKERREQGGTEVILTRSGDSYAELKERARLANEAGADSFVSIHANAASADGSETYCFVTNAEKAVDMKKSSFRNEAANAIYLGLNEYH